MPRIPVFDNRASLPGKSGLVQQDPEKASMLAGAIADSAIPIGGSLEGLFGDVFGAGNDPAKRTSLPGVTTNRGLDPATAPGSGPAELRRFRDAVYLAQGTRTIAHEMAQSASRAAVSEDPLSADAAGEVGRALQAGKTRVRGQSANVSAEAQQELALRLEGYAIHAAHEGEARQVAAAYERALDVMEAVTDELVTAAGQGGDPEAAFSSIDQLVGDYTGALSEEELANYRANTRREVIAAHVSGLSRRGRIEAARAALKANRAELPDGEAAWLERTIARGETVLRQAVANERTRRMLELATRARAGEDVGWDAERLIEAGAIGPAERRQIARVTREAEARREGEDALKEHARVAVTTGAALDPVNPDDRLAAELWWRDVGATLFDGLSPERRADAVAHAVAQLGTVPNVLRRDLVLGLRDDTTALAAAQQVLALADTAPAAANVAFSPNELSYAGALRDLDAAGAGDPLGSASAIEPLGQPKLRPVANRRGESVTGMAAGDQSALDIISELTALADLDGPFDEDRANSLFDLLEAGPLEANPAMLAPLLALLAKLAGKAKGAGRFLGRIVRWIGASFDDLFDGPIEESSPQETAGEEELHPPVNEESSTSDPESADDTEDARFDRSLGESEPGTAVRSQQSDEDRKSAFREVMGLDYERYLRNADQDRRIASEDDPLDNEPRVAFNLYTTEMLGGGDSTYLLVNDALRDGRLGNDPRVDAIIDMMDLGVEQLPVFEGTVFRSVDLDPEQEATLVSGGVWLDPGFMSASRDETRTPHGRKYMFVITTHSGHDIAPYSRSGLEQEILIPRALEFDIISVEPRPDGTIIVRLLEKNT